MDWLVWGLVGSGCWAYPHFLVVGAVDFVCFGWVSYSAPYIFRGPIGSVGFLMGRSIARCSGRDFACHMLEEC